MRSPGRALPPLPPPPPAAASERPASGSAPLFPPPPRGRPSAPSRDHAAPRAAGGPQRPRVARRETRLGSREQCCPGRGEGRGAGDGEAGSPQAAHPHPASPSPLALTTNPGGSGAPCHLGTGTLRFCVPSTSSYVTPLPISDRKIFLSPLSCSSVPQQPMTFEALHDLALPPRPLTHPLRSPTGLPSGPLVHQRPAPERSPHIPYSSFCPGCEHTPQRPPLTSRSKALHQLGFSSLYFSFTASTATCNYIFIWMFMILMAVSFTRL